MAEDRQGGFGPPAGPQRPLHPGALAEIKLEGQKEPKAAARTGEAPGRTQTYLAVFGDVDFADNAYFNLFGNGDLFLNTVNFLAAEENQITVREARKAQFLTLTTAQAEACSWSAWWRPLACSWLGSGPTAGGGSGDEAPSR